MPNFLQAKQGKLGVAASRLVGRKPPGPLTWLRTLCRSTFIQYSCFSRSAVFYIPTIKQRNCVLLSQICSHYLTAAWKSANSPISPGGSFGSRADCVGRTSPAILKTWQRGVRGRLGGGGSDIQLRLHLWRGFHGTGVLLHGSCSDCWPAVFPRRPPIMRLVSFSEEVQACAWCRFSCAAHGCFWLKPGQCFH